jgi:hypothetical protein
LLCGDSAPRSRPAALAASQDLGSDRLMVTSLALEDSGRSELVEAFAQLLGLYMFYYSSPHSQMCHSSPHSQLIAPRSTAPYSRSGRGALHCTGCWVAQVASDCGYVSISCTNISKCIMDACSDSTSHFLSRSRGRGDGAQLRCHWHDLQRRSSCVARPPLQPSRPCACLSAVLLERNYVTAIRKY